MVLIIRLISSFSIMSTIFGEPSVIFCTVLTLILLSESALAVPLVATKSKPISVSFLAMVMACSLSEFFTEMKAVPEVSNLLPAASCALANASGKFSSMPMTSPVDFISGPRMMSALLKRANGKTTSLTEK